MSDHMRAEFEAAYLAKYDLKPQNWNGVAYLHAHGNGAWWAWQASRAALCVELPNPSQAMKLVMNYQEHLRQNVTGTTNWAANLGMHVVDECRAAIESTGVRTK